MLKVSKYLINARTYDNIAVYVNYLSAQKKKTKEGSRIYEKNEHKDRQEGFSEAQKKGKGTACRMKNVYAREGIFIKGNFVSVKITRIKGGGAIYFVVGQKVAKKAAARNRIKRRLRAAAARGIGKPKPGTAIFLMPSSDIVSKSFSEIEEELEKVFRKAGILL